MVKPSIAVVLPAYNGSAYLTDAVTSVWHQTRLPDAIAVVDDRSSDGTADLAEELGARSPVPMRVIRLAKNTGSPARPINVGVEATRADLITILDQDDVLESDSLALHATALADPGVSLSATCCGRLAGGECFQSAALIDRLTSLGTRGIGGVRMAGDAFLHELVLKSDFLIGYPAFAFRRHLWAKRGGVDTSLRIASDYDFLCWLCRQGDVVFHPRVGYRRREHDNNMCNNRVRMHGDVFRVRTRYVGSCPRLCEPGPDRDALQAEYRSFAYWARRGGHYRAAAAVTLQAVRAWGPSRFAAAELTKLIPDMLLSALVRRPRAKSPWTDAPAQGPTVVPEEVPC